MVIGKYTDYCRDICLTLVIITIAKYEKISQQDFNDRRNINVFS